MKRRPPELEEKRDLIPLEIGEKKHWCQTGLKRGGTKISESNLQRCWSMIKQHPLDIWTPGMSMEVIVTSL